MVGMLRIRIYGHLEYLGVRKTKGGVMGRMFRSRV